MEKLKFSVQEWGSTLWRMNRKNKQGCRVMLMVKMDISVEEVICGKGQVDVLQVIIKGNVKE